MKKIPCRARVLAMAVTAAALGFASVAQAEVVAIATDQLTGFTITPSSGTLSFDPNSPASRTSAASATFNGVGVATSDPVMPPNPSNAQPATAGTGPFPVDNTGYNQGTAVTFTRGGFGDSNVFGNFLAGGSTVNATGQAFLPDLEAGSATGTGRVQTAGNVLLTLAGGGPATLTVSFTDDLNLYVSSTTSGGTAQATTSAQFVIRDSTGAVVFSFTPNGVNEGATVLNTTEISDPFTLNTEISALGAETNMLNPGPLFFSASTTTPLPEGTYQLDLLVNKTAVVRQQAIPEPSSALLMALALAGAGVVTRRKTRG